MANPALRVRRAVAEAFVQIGHPKGNSRRDIAERRVAAPSSAARAADYAKAKANRGSTDWVGRLQSTSPDHIREPILGKPGVLFLCPGNSARSQMGKPFSAIRRARTTT
ncbi:MAG: hypothetical protein ACKV0T_14070 [Planctomycetales bacterium]